MPDDLSLNFNLNPEVSLEALRAQMDRVQETLVVAAREAVSAADKALAKLGLTTLADFRKNADQSFTTLSTAAGRNAKRIGEDFNATFGGITRGLQQLEGRGTKILETAASNAAKVAREASLGTVRNLEADGASAIRVAEGQTKALDAIAKERGLAQVDAARVAANAATAVQRDADIALGRAQATIVAEQGKTVEELKRQNNAAQLAIIQEGVKLQNAATRDGEIVKRKLIEETNVTTAEIQREANRTTEINKRESVAAQVALEKQKNSQILAEDRDATIIQRKVIEGQNATTQAFIVEGARRTTATKRAALQEQLQQQRSDDNLELAEVRGHQARVTEVWKRGWQLITTEQKNFITKHRENQRNANVLSHIEEQRAADESIATTKSQLRQQEELQTAANKRLLSSQELSQRASSVTSGGVTGALTGRSSIGIGLRNLAFIGGGAFGIANTIKIGEDFAQTLATVGAAANLSAADLERVRKVSIDLGNDISLPGVSAKEGADAIGLMAKSGINLDATLTGAARAALQLARAAGVDVPAAVQIVDDSINVFRLSGQDAQRTVDDLAGSIKIAGGETIPEFANAFQSSSAVFESTFATAASGAENFRQLNAAIDLLGKNGVRGETAGTAIRNALVRLTAPTKAGQKALDEIAKSAGVTGDVLFDASGKTRQFKDVVDILAKGLSGFATEQQRDTAFVDIFGAKSQIAARLLSEQSDVFKANLAVLVASETVYSKSGLAIQKQGAAAKLAAAQNSGLKGAVDALVSQFQTLQIELFLLVNNPARTVILGISNAISLLAEDSRFTAIRHGLVGVAIAGGALLILKTAAEGTQLLTIALQALATSPIALFSTALLGAAFAIGFFSTKNKEFGDAVKLLGNQLKDFGSLLVKDIIDGDFAKAKDDLLNIIKAIVTFPLLSTLTDALVKQGKDVLKTAEDIGSGIVTSIAKGIGFTAHTVVTLLTDIIRGDFVGAGQILADAAGKAFLLLPTGVAAVGKKIAEEILKGFSTAIDFGKVLWPKVRDVAVQIPGEVADFGAAIWRGIVAGFSGSQKSTDLKVAVQGTGLTPEQAGALAGVGAFDTPSVQKSLGEAIGRAIIAGVKFALAGIETAGKLIAEALFNKFTIEAVAGLTAGILAAAIILGGTFIKGFAEGIDHNKGSIVEGIAKVLEVAIGSGLLIIKQLLLHSPIWLEIATAIGLIFGGAKIFGGIAQSFNGMKANLASGLAALNGNFGESRQIAADYQKSLRAVRVGEVDALGSSLPAAARSINQGLIVPFQKAKAAVLDFLGASNAFNPQGTLARPLTQQAAIPTIPGLGIVPAVGPSSPLNPIAIQAPAGLNSFVSSLTQGPSQSTSAEADRVAALNTQINGLTTATKIAGAAALTASAGMTAFFAFSSTDSTARLASAVGLIGTLGAALATGDPLVIGFSVAAAGLGAILGNNAKQAKAAADRTKEWLDILKSGTELEAKQKAIDDFSKKIEDGDKNATAFAKNTNARFDDLTDAIFKGTDAVKAYKEALIDKTLDDALAGQGAEADFVAKRLKQLQDTGDSYAEAVKKVRSELATKPEFNFIDDQAKAYKDASAKQDLVRAAIGNTKQPQQDVTTLAQADATARADALASALALLGLLSGQAVTTNNLSLGLVGLKEKVDAAFNFTGSKTELGKLQLEIDNTKHQLSDEFVVAAQHAVDAAIALGEDPITAVNNLKKTIHDQLVNELGLSETTAQSLLGEIDKLSGKQINLILTIAADAAAKALLDKAFALAAATNPADFGVDIGATVGSLTPKAASGAIITRQQLITVGEGDKPEVIIPLTDKTRALQLAQQSGLLKLLNIPLSGLSVANTVAGFGGGTLALSALDSLGLTHPEGAPRAIDAKLTNAADQIATAARNIGGEKVSIRDLINDNAHNFPAATTPPQDQTAQGGLFNGTTINRGQIENRVNEPLPDSPATLFVKNALPNIEAGFHLLQNKLKSGSITDEIVKATIKGQIGFGVGTASESLITGKQFELDPVQRIVNAIIDSKIPKLNPTGLTPLDSGALASGAIPFANARQTILNGVFGFKDAIDNIGSGIGDAIRDQALADGGFLGKGKIDPAAADVGTGLGQKISDTMRAFLESLAAPEIKVDADTSLAQAKIDSLISRIGVGGGVGLAAVIGSGAGIQIQGAATGAIIDHEQILRVGERGRKEAIIPLTDPDRAFALMVATGLDKLVTSRATAPTQSSAPPPREAPLIGELHTHEVAADPLATGIVVGRQVASIIQGVLV